LPTGKILVIAASADLRRSLSFALEAEGHVVTSLGELVDPRDARGFDCVVLDHKVAKAVTREAVLAFCAEAPPVILLAGAPQPWLVPQVFHVVETPSLGPALTTAVQDALAPMPALLA
jgi:DNA-binding NtrC family response regulator